MSRNECFERTVIGPFDIRRETASRQLIHAQVIMQALAALAMLGASGVGTVALLVIFGDSFASHVVYHSINPIVSRSILDQEPAQSQIRFDRVLRPMLY